MQNLSWRLAATAVALAFIPSFAIADDWVVTKLRGSAAVLVGENWQPLHRGDVISDDRAIQTLSGSRATLERGPEKIELGPETAVRIDDAATARYTTVRQYFGTVTVEAEVQNVEHFGVLTPHLAAVVKGTRFTVVSGEDTATVSVLRGHVAVEDRDTHETTLLAVGQSASTSDGGAPLSISGEGTLPTVYGAGGKPVTDVNKSAADGAKAAEKQAREAAKEGRAEAKAAEKEATSEGKGSDNGGSNGSSGNSGSESGGGSNAGSDSGGGKKDKG
jgi:uncharacterized membrane protein YgcG